MILGVSASSLSWSDVWVLFWVVCLFLHVDGILSIFWWFGVISANYGNTCEIILTSHHNRTWHGCLSWRWYIPVHFHYQGAPKWTSVLPTWSPPTPSSYLFSLSRETENGNRRSGETLASGGPGLATWVEVCALGADWASHWHLQRPEWHRCSFPKWEAWLGGSGHMATLSWNLALLDTGWLSTARTAGAEVACLPRDGLCQCLGMCLLWSRGQNALAPLWGNPVPVLW